MLSQPASAEVATKMSSEKDERLATEVALLESMYPDQVTFNRKSQEMSYVLHNASLHLRLPAGYLIDSLPEVLSANVGKQDLRDTVKESITTHETGEEVLDSIIFTFNDAMEQTASQLSNTHESTNDSPLNDGTSFSKVTMMIFLHHLLNTNKRKLCLSPSHPSISGVTKPGYPGVLVYSGPSHAVREHVNELKAQNWAAFQIRSEIEGEEWEFKHGKGVVEVESMGDVVAEVDVREGRKQVFMEAMRMK